MSNKVSIRDIAAETGYSAATVSNVLNNKGNVGAKATQAILDAIDRMGYRRRGGIDHITFVVARRNGKAVDSRPFHPAVIEGLEAAARKVSLRVSLSILNLDDNTNLRRQINELRQDPHGSLVVLATEMTTDDDYALFDGCECPLAFVDGWSERLPFDTISIANESAAYRAATHLVACGHQHIGYIGLDFRIRNFPLRERGFNRALHDVDLELRDEDRLLVDPNPTLAAEQITDWAKASKDLPTAIFCDNDTIAAEAVRGLRDVSLSVPGDVSVIGFDDQDVCRLITPQLTTMRVPKQLMGRLAVESIRHQIDEGPGHEPIAVQVHASLLERESVRKI